MIPDDTHVKIRVSDWSRERGLASRYGHTAGTREVRAESPDGGLSPEIMTREHLVKFNDWEAWVPERELIEVKHWTRGGVA